MDNINPMKAIILYTQTAVSISLSISCLDSFCAAALAAVEVISTAAQCEAKLCGRSLNT